MEKKIFAHLVVNIVLYTLPVMIIAQTNAVFLGTKTPYTSPVNNKSTPAPSGYKAVFVNYTGRHGARFLTKAGSDIDVLSMLLWAEKNNALTDIGKRLLKMTQRFLTIEKNNYEKISLLGSKEQEGIGERILKNYPQAFKGGDIDVMMTHKVRTQQSAYAFLKAFSGYKGKKNFEIVPDSLDNTLRFYDLSPAYQAFKKDTSLLTRIDSLKNDSRTRKTAENICAKIFIASFTEKLFDIGFDLSRENKSFKMDGVDFAGKLYDLYSVQFSIPIEMNQKGFTKDSINFGIAFEKKDLEWLDFKNGAEDFLEKGAGLDTLGIQVKIALPLLAEYLNSIQKVINTKGRNAAIFRFTHAEAISPFATLLGLPEASVASPSIYHYHDYWKTASIIPLSANISWILYSNGKDFFVKVLLNEKETHLPIATKHYPYYSWKDVKSYYENKMERLGAPTGTNMQSYLTDFK